MSKKVSALFSLTVLLALALNACTGATATPTQAPAPTQRRWRPPHPTTAPVATTAPTTAPVATTAPNRRRRPPPRRSDQHP